MPFIQTSGATWDLRILIARVGLSDCRSLTGWFHGLLFGAWYPKSNQAAQARRLPDG